MICCSNTSSKDKTTSINILRFLIIEVIAQVSLKEFKQKVKPQGKPACRTGRPWTLKGIDPIRWERYPAKSGVQPSILSAHCMLVKIRVSLIKKEP